MFQSIGQDDHLIPAHHAWALTGPQQFKGVATTGLAGNPLTKEQEESIVLLGQWPDDVDEVIIEQMHRLHWPVPAWCQDMSLEEATGLIVNILRDFSVPSVFKPMYLTEQAKSAICVLNARSGQEEFCTDHVQSWFLGTSVPWDPPHTPVLSPELVESLILLSNQILKQKLLQVSCGQ